MPGRQPPTTTPFGRAAFGRLVRRVRRNSGASRQFVDGSPAAPLPGEVGFQLTNRCNLRCKHCFQWGETGSFLGQSKQFRREELDFALIEKVFSETREVGSDMFVWGGEPLVYSRFRDFLALLEYDARWTVICTNGIGLDRFLDNVLPASSSIVFLFSLDGFSAQNDAMRARGTFERTLGSIKQLLSAQVQGEYDGVVSVNCVLSDALIEHMYEFALFMEDLAVDTLYFNYPWFIPKATAERMDEYYAENFTWLGDQDRFERGPLASWHSYSYSVTRDRIEDLAREIERIYARTWRIRVKFQPALSPDEIRGFLSGSERPGEGRTRCISIATRMNVLPSGAVTTCKLFPEFSIGDLNTESTREIWSSYNAKMAREVLSRGLTPVCSKCVQLYLNKPKPGSVRDGGPRLQLQADL
jgi:MoaA/NifB/PqqE/SkfB family radical SAM enzyme